MCSEEPEHRFDEAAEVLQALDQREQLIAQPAAGELQPLARGDCSLAGLGRTCGCQPAQHGVMPSAEQRQQLQPAAGASGGSRTELAEQWLAAGLPVTLPPASNGWRDCQLPPSIRAQLGRLRAGDWQQPREALLKQGVHPRVVEHLVSAGAQDLLPVTMRGRKPADPFLQLWIAAAIQSLDDVEIVRLKARPLEPAITSLPIPAGGARLVLVEAPAGDAVALGINGTPLMQMMVFGVNGQVEEERGPLRVTRIAPEAGSPLQVLVTNEGVSSSLFTLSCRADPLDQ